MKGEYELSRICTHICFNLRRVFHTHFIGLVLVAYNQIVSVIMIPFP